MGLIDPRFEETREEEMASEDYAIGYDNGHAEGVTEGRYQLKFQIDRARKLLEGYLGTGGTKLLDIETKQFLDEDDE